MALSSALDRLGYIRVMWEWLKDPAVDWANPSQVLAKAPTSSAVTDCKSVYDLATKTCPSLYRVQNNFRMFAHT